MRKAASGQCIEGLMQRFLITSVMLIAATPAFAAEGGSTNVMEIRADTAIWAIVVFAGLFVILRSKAWPMVLDGLQKREDAIRLSLEEAKKVRADMITLKSDFEKELAESHQQIPKLMEEGRKKAEELSNEMRAKATADIHAERERLRREIDVAKDQAIKKLWEHAAQLATLISAKAIGRSLSEDDHRRLIDEALKEMTTRNN